MQHIFHLKTFLQAMQYVGFEIAMTWKVRGIWGIASRKRVQRNAALRPLDEKKAGEGDLSRCFGYYCFWLTTSWLKGISMPCLSHMSFSSRFRAREAA